MQYFRKLFGSERTAASADGLAESAAGRHLESAADPHLKAAAEPTPGAEVESPADSTVGVSFRDLMWQLGSASERTRHDVAILLSALGHRGAIRPLVRAYLAYGDEPLLEALRPFGPKLTPVTAREVRDMSLSPIQRSRLMDVLAVSADPGAVTLLLPATDDADARVHVAACRALAELGDPRGVDKLADDLLKFDADLRFRALQALQELQRLDDPAAAAAIKSSVQSYLAAGGAVPRRVKVSLPLLVSPDVDLVDLIVAHVRHSPRGLTVVTGPAMDTLAERQREALSRGLPGCELFFATPRHSADEQLAVLMRARDRSAADPAARAVLVGRLPSPEGPQPFTHFLTCLAGTPYTARVVVIGPQRFALVMEWWRYIDDRAEVPTDLEVVLANLVLGRDHLTAEEMTIYHLAGEDRRDDFARAFLAQL